MMFKRLIAIAVSAAMVLTMTPAALYAGTDDMYAGTDDMYAGTDGQAGSTEKLVLEEGTFVPGEVIVVFKTGAVKDQKMSLSKATGLENVGEGFGETMESTGEAKEAAEDAKSEVSILKKSLGDDFEIVDSMAFDEELITALIKSEKYETEVLIEKLKDNPDVESAEPNWRTEEKSTYSLDDVFAKYAYHTNSSKDENLGGENVSARGVDPKHTISTSAGSVTDFKTPYVGDEIVVAVNDSGINYDHEDLKDVLWTNPGNIGLDGEHGFNFDDNMTDVKDTLGHGTHVSGIIAAKANNGKGVAGVASGVNAKIMMLATNSAQEGPNDNQSLYRRSGALYYALRAKERGVNVVAINNSWGSPGPSCSYDKILDKLGEAGIISFIAASNDAVDIDKLNYCPPGGGSPYTVVVGSANIDGKPSGFSDVGKSNVDLFAPGTSILSTVSYSSYFPDLYTAEERAENTEFYGQFSSETKIGPEVVPDLGMKEVVPETHGEGVKAFGPAKFFVQDSDFDPDGGDEEEEEEEEGGDDPELPDATVDVSIAEDKFFTDNFDAASTAKPATLKVTVNNAKVGERYFIYFPFAKNHDTTGYDNTRYSMTLITQNKEDEFSANMSAGEVLKHDDEGTTYCELNDGDLVKSDPMYADEVYHIRSKCNTDESCTIASWDDVDPETTDVVETGMGVEFTVYKGGDIKTPEEEEFIKGAHPVTFYLDSLAVSEPVTEEGKTPEDVFTPDTSYDLMSGTSMATPAATGAYAVLCALEPKQEGESDKDYARRNRARFLSLVTRKDEFSDLCSTGGYIDLYNLTTEAVKTSISNAVCNVENGTLRLFGAGLSDDLKLYKKKIAEEKSEEVLIEKDRVKVSDDGKSLTISDAWDLFGTYTEFILKDSGGVRAKGSFFLVAGQKEPELVLSEEHKETEDDTVLPVRAIFTDKNGQLYANNICSYSLFEKTAGTLFKYDGKKFVEYQGTRLSDAVFDYFEDELGYNRHEITRGLEITPKIMKQPVVDGDTLYAFVDTAYSPREDAEEEEIVNRSYLAALDFTSSKPSWRFTEIDPLGGVLEDIGDVEEGEAAYCMFNGKIYTFCTVSDTEGTFVLTMDPETGKWDRLPDHTDATLIDMITVVKDGRIYLLFGSEGSTVVNKNVYTFDGKTWAKDGEIPLIGKLSTIDSPNGAAAAALKDGIIVFNYSADGAGNVYLYNTTTHECEPMYYTICKGLTDALYDDSSETIVEANDGLYFIRKAEDDAVIKRYDLYRIPKSSHEYRPTYKDANPMKVTVKKVSAKAKPLKKKSATKKAVTVKSAAGKVTFARGKISCAKKLAKTAKAKIKVNKKTGNITLKKGLKKGKYTVSITVSASGNDYCKSGKKTVKVKITVK